MPKRKEKVQSKTQAIVRVTHGSGKRARSVDLLVDINFSQIYHYSNDTDARTVTNFAQGEAQNQMVRTKVLDSKSLITAYKAWKKSKEI